MEGIVDAIVVVDGGINFRGGLGVFGGGVFGGEVAVLGDFGGFGGKAGGTSGSSIG